MTDAQRFVPWHQAWHEALYGPGGFYHRSEGPAGHFRTACHAGAGVLAAALLRLADLTGCTGIIDVGAGRGELLTALAEAAADRRPEEPLPDDLPDDLFLVPTADASGGSTTHDGPTPLRLHGVDVIDRPPGLPAEVGWSRELPTLPDDVLDGALVVAWELLDVVPGPIAEVAPDGAPRLLLVDPATGTERPGPPLTAVESAWCARWWPLAGTEPGTRAEIGTTRDALWAELVRRLAASTSGGVVLAVDYDHDHDHRPSGGSLSAFRRGRAVTAVPDGDCDLTTHVALDAVAAAGQRAGAGDSLLLRQRAALRALGVGMTPGDLAAARAAGTAALLAQLEVRSRMDELLDESGLGGFGWLIQGVRRPLPPSLHRAAEQLVP